MSTSWSPSSRKWEWHEVKRWFWVEHDGTAVKDATLAGGHRRSQAGRSPSAGRRPGRRRASRDAAAKIAGVGKVHVADDAAYAHALAENVAPLVAELMGASRRLRRARHHHRQEHRPARRRAARRHADQRHPFGRGRRHLHPPDLRRQRHRHGQIVGRQEGLTVRGTAFAKAAAEGGSATIEAVAAQGRRGPVQLRRAGDRQAASAPN